MFWNNQTLSSETTVYSGSPLVDGSDYYLRVMTMDVGGLWSPWAENKFHMNTKPPTPTPQSPADGTLDLSDGTRDLSWTTVTDAEGSSIVYYWYVSHSADFSTTQFQGTSTSASTSIDTQYSKTYYWRVRAFDGYEFGDNSTAFMFKTVYYGSISGTVRDELGNLIMGASVSIQGTALVSTTDVFGRYSIEHVSPGSYNVTASKAGYVSSMISIQLTAAQQKVTDFLLFLERSSIRGTVLDKDGVPIEGATVTLYDAQNNEVESTITYSNGEFILSEIDFGTYTVKITKDGYEEISKDVTIDSLAPLEMDPVKLGKTSELPIMWIIVAIVIIVVVLLVLLMVFRRKRPVAEEKKEMEEESTEPGEEFIVAEDYSEDQ
jgi:hypothetical protein